MEYFPEKGRWIKPLNYRTISTHLIWYRFFGFVFISLYLTLYDKFNLLYSENHNYFFPMEENSYTKCSQLFSVSMYLYADHISNEDSKTLKTRRVDIIQIVRVIMSLHHIYTIVVYYYFRSTTTGLISLAKLSGSVRY